METVRRERFDVIPMDLHMPIMDGFAAAATIRSWLRQANRPTVPIIPFSTGAPEVHRARCEASGMVSYVRKPASREALIRQVRYWVGRSRVDRAWADGEGRADGHGPVRSSEQTTDG